MTKFNSSKHELQSNDVFDITILGGGPTGLFAAFYAGMRHAKCKIIDSMPELGGRLISVYPEKYIYDVAGFPKVLAKELIESLKTQIEPYNTTICLEENALTLESKVTEKSEYPLWLLETQKGFHWTKTLILASGVGMYSPKKHAGLNAHFFEQRGISYAVLDKNYYRNKKVIVVGGGDSALDWANELVHIANHVTLIHRTEKFRAHDASVLKFQKTNFPIYLNTEIIEYCGDNLLQNVILENKMTGEKEEINCDEVVVMIGFHSSLGKIKEWGLDLSGNGIVVNEKMETNLPGIFAAGDVAKHSAKLDLIATGFAEAATAVAFAKVYLNPKEKAQPLHSTTIMEKNKRLN